MAGHPPSGADRPHGSAGSRVRSSTRPSPPPAPARRPRGPPPPAAGKSVTTSIRIGQNSASQSTVMRLCSTSTRSSCPGPAGSQRSRSPATTITALAGRSMKPSTQPSRTPARFTTSKPDQVLAVMLAGLQRRQFARGRPTARASRARSPRRDRRSLRAARPAPCREPGPPQAAVRASQGPARRPASAGTRGSGSGVR